MQKINGKPSVKLDCLADEDDHDHDPVAGDASVVVKECHASMLHLYSYLISPGIKTYAISFSSPRKEKCLARQK